MMTAGLEICVLGTLAVRRNGEALAIPRSRKVRALLAFLALTPGLVRRSRLCDLLWDAPNDPRGELRWCLSKIRSLVDSPDHRRVIASSPDLVGLELGDCVVDATDVDRAAAAGFGQASDDRLREVCARFGGELLDGEELDGGPELGGWLVAQRHRYRGLRIAALDELIRRTPPGSDDAFRYLETWLQLAPFDPRPHGVLLTALVHRGRLQEADDHLAATIRAFEQDGVDWSALRDALRAARAAAAPAARVEVSDGERMVKRPTRRRASVAVMPFVEPSGGPEGGRVADGLTEDIITGLAKLRVLFVIARGTVYALSERSIGSQEAGRILNVEFVVTGSVRRAGGRISVRLEVAETQDARIVWTDELHCVTDAAMTILDETIDRIVAAIADEIEAAECKRAVLKPPSSLDAWEAHHRGLWHMYKFTGPDNRHAEHFFRTSLAFDPTFARAYAGLSFTHFQNAFLDLTADREHQIEQAFTAATQSVATDDRDPAAHWAMGRALWLRGANDASLEELRRCIDLSPNFALGHYTLGFVHSQAGDPRAAIESTDYSRQLSPFDPLQFAMLATRAIAHVRLGELQEAADWAVKATARPNAHAHILAIAIHCLALADRRDEAGAFIARIRSRLPAYGVDDFLRAFRFARDTEQLFRRSARELGF